MFNQMRSTILVGLLILVLIFSTVSSGIIRMVKADSVIGSPIVVSKAPYRDLFDPDNGLIYVAGNHVSVGGNGGNVTVVDPSKNQAIKNITEPF